VKRNTLIGAVLGLLIGLGIAALFERLDRRIKDPKDLEEIYGLPLLGVIPESDPLSDALPWDALSAGETEAFRMIRAQLRYFNVDRDLRTVLVISAAQGDGKTTVSRRLAEAGAAMGAFTLLLEVDMRAPTLDSQLGIGPGSGLSDVLSGNSHLSEAVERIDAGPAVGGLIHQMDVLRSGSMLAPNPAELIESHTMQSVIAQVAAAYQFIVIDTPPLTAVSDAFPLLSKVDGVIIVGRMGRRRDVAQRLNETLKKADAPTLGVVANGFRGRGGGQYTYGYGGDA
jgi:receptor protein-tyrosine kinase